MPLQGSLNVELSKKRIARQGRDGHTIRNSGCCPGTSMAIRVRRVTAELRAQAGGANHAGRQPSRRGFLTGAFRICCSLDGSIVSDWGNAVLLSAARASIFSNPFSALQHVRVRASD
jgi:hypothetical protein